MKTQLLRADRPEDLACAADLLRNGGLVAIPTETVYGLAANALDPAAVARIFEAKGRPQDNPLIVHVASMEEIPPLVAQVDPRLSALADAFWPGPLTVVMKKSDRIPAVVSAGLDTVAIRMPSHPTAHAVIAAAGVPLAAPSANTSGRPSPTRASHVLTDLDGRIDAVLEGGESEVGVESTVITLTTDPPTLLRPGGITHAQLEQVLGRIQISPAVFAQLRSNETAQSPGMKYKHYAPKTAVTLVKGSFEQYKRFVDAQKTPVCAVCFRGEGQSFDHAIEYGLAGDGNAQAHDVFDALRRIDGAGCARALVRCPDPSGVGLAVYNRLLRAAAFRVIDLEIRIPVLGLTGQTGAGKSTVSALLAARGCAIIDCDLIARTATDLPAVQAALCDAFGSDILRDGELDRRLLARRAFADAAHTAALNAITHPEITRLTVEAIHQAEADGACAAVIDAALLLDSDLTALCDRIISVLAPDDVRLQRICARDGISEADARLRMAAQPPAEYYASHADLVLHNDGDLSALQQAVDAVLPD
ncbi:MAG: threonylcarbamoyl-AMP synthase [Clostridia bacterium]|nr:threonylcarbamoyl-AMP synthase [Clostridia bacterium]